MLEAAGKNLVQGPLPGVAEGGVAQVVPQGGGFRQVLVQVQRPGHRPGQAADLQRVGQTGAVMVPLRLQKHLGLVLQAAEGLGVGDPVNIPLKAGADLALRLRLQAAFAVFRQNAIGPDDGMLGYFSLPAGTEHGVHLLPCYSMGQTKSNGRAILPPVTLIRPLLLFPFIFLKDFCLRPIPSSPSRPWPAAAGPSSPDAGRPASETGGGR